MFNFDRINEVIIGDINTFHKNDKYSVTPILDKTPEIYDQICDLANIGFRLPPTNKLYMQTSKLAKGLFSDISTKSGHHLSLDIDVVKEAIESIDRPLMVFRYESKGVKRINVIMDTFDKKSELVIFGISPDLILDGQIMKDTNHVATIFGKPTDDIIRWINEGKLLYYDKILLSQPQHWKLLAAVSGMKNSNTLDEKLMDFDKNAVVSDSRMTYFYPNGEKMAEVDKNCRTGRFNVRFYYRSGTTKSTATERCGGACMKSEFSICEGRFDGRWQSYFPSGLNQSEGVFRNGIPIGTIIEYYKNKNIRLRETRFENGIAKEITEFLKNGQKLPVGTTLKDLANAKQGQTKKHKMKIQ